MSRILRLASVVAFAIGVVLAVAWLSRRPLSEAIVARWFASEGIPARYRVTALSTDAVTLADVALGSVSAPDFTADRVDVRLGWSPFRPRVDHVTLVRPALHAVLGPRGLSVGSLDRLLPPQYAPATPLPDIDLTLIDARATLATRAGNVVVAGGGRGRLRGGFVGRFVVANTRLTGSDCTGVLPGATLAVATTREAVRVIGDGAAASVGCAGGVAAAGIGWHADLRLPPKLDAYTVALSARSGPARVGGFTTAGFDVTADGMAATPTGPVAGAFAIVARNGRNQSSSVARIAAQGSYRLNPRDGDANLNGRVSVTRAGVLLPLKPLRDAATRLRGTFATPLANALAGRLEAAARAFDATGAFTVARQNARTTGSIGNVVFAAATGARLVQTGSLALTGRGIAVDGSVAMDGGGLPAATLSAAGRWQEGVATGTGTLVTERWAVPVAAVEPSRLALVATREGVRMTGNARVSGALGGGVLASRLGFALDGRIDRDGGIVVGEHCLPIDWSTIARGEVTLAGGKIIVCPKARPILTIIGGTLRGGATVGNFALRGSVGAADFALTTTPARADVSGTAARPRIAVARATLSGRLGTRSATATIDGVFDIARSRGQGSLERAAVDDPASPVRIDTVGAKWRLDGARIDLAQAGARIVDRAARFQPLDVAEGTASLANGAVRAGGTVLLAATKARLGRFDARHDVASGSGSAALDTGAIGFGPSLQPVDITESLRGIVANVRGPVAGTGHVEWTATGVTSRGTLRIDDLALATEALGPVDGIAGTIAFDDLLALTTPPGQTLRIARINPGVVVDDGVAVFRLLGPDAAAIESIRWPYAGGTLALAPVTLRAGDVRREFVMTVDGIDAEQFLQRFEIKNLNVTGRFDGTLPLIFADGHGRIAGGSLVARPGGGLVQYVGEIGSADTGAAARLAFDALRRLRYRNLTLDLDGDLDGELVTQLRFAGTNEAAATLAGGPLPLTITGLPFRFGITVRAPFRALLGTTASFSDVRPLLRTPTPPPPVQPK